MPARELARPGQPAPRGGVFDRFAVEALPIVVPINARGQATFFATVARGTAGEGFFLSGGTSLSRVAAEGDRAPGGGTLSGFGRHPVPALNGRGAVAFAAAVTGGRTVEGVFVAASGRLQALAVAGDAAPGVSSGTFASLDLPSINDHGDVALLATVRRGRETFEAIYLRADGRLRKVAAQGDPAPAGGSFAGFGAPVLNNRGAVAFAGLVEGIGVPGGIFIADRGGVRMVVGAGDNSPIGGVFSKFSERVALNDAGALAYTAVLNNGPTAAAIFLTEGARVRKVVAIGDEAPGGGTFSYLGLWPALDASGAVAFIASLDRGPAPVGAFVAGAAGLRRVAAVGDSLSSGGTIGSFGLYPAVSMAPDGTIGFAVVPTGATEPSLYLVGSSAHP